MDSDSFFPPPKCEPICLCNRNVKDAYCNTTQPFGMTYKTVFLHCTIMGMVIYCSFGV